ncbi:MAG: metallophosphoesterase [Pseudomonadota bacterium]
MISRRTFLKSAGGLFAGSGLMGTYAFAIEPLYRLKVTKYQPQLTGWNKNFHLKIAVLTDIHACKPWMDVERIRHIVTKTNALKPDIILLLGDYVSGMNLVTEYVHSDDWGPVLGELKAPLGVHAVLGNHDWWEDPVAQRRGAGPTIVHKALSRAGIAIYENDALKITQKGKDFWLACLGDQLAFPPRKKFGRKKWKTMDDLSGTLAQVTDEAPVILMAHEPDVFPRVPERVCLTLSGHTHGGQVRIGSYAPINTSGQKHNYGLVKEGKKKLIVSGGLGCSMLPVRFGTPPEIVLIELGQPNEA